MGTSRYPKSVDEDYRRHNPDVAILGGSRALAITLPAKNSCVRTVVDCWRLYDGCSATNTMRGIPYRTPSLLPSAPSTRSRRAVSSFLLRILMFPFADVHVERKPCQVQ
jgi:hypothetical protein